MAVNGSRRNVAVYLLLFLTGCVAGISRQALSQVTYTGTFAALQKNPELHSNELVLLGREILETSASTASSEVTFLQLPLGRRGRPPGFRQLGGPFPDSSRSISRPSHLPEGSLANYSRSAQRT
jgi:starvation-inducible outer membrane lipoprotein